MKNYVYVVAYEVPEEDGISFRHIFLQAVDDDDAYIRGMEQLDDTLEERCNLLNNYVIELP